jgi:hypothetical protein
MVVTGNGCKKTDKKDKPSGAVKFCLDLVFVPEESAGASTLSSKAF